MDEHRALMGVVIEKVQSAKRGLTEACSSLLTGFDLRDDVQGENPSVDQ